MKQKLLIVGSIAFDHLMRYEGVFQEKILPEHLHTLSVSFAVAGRKTAFGGCGGNIAFHFKKQGGDSLLFGLVGKDFSDYEAWLEKHSINTSWLSKKENENTSAAFVLTDTRGHQITIFDEGAAKDFSFEDLTALRNMVVTYQKEIAFAIIAPTNTDLMKTAALMCHELHIPYFFDPGQQIIKFSKEDLRSLIEKAYGLFTNEYEMQLLMKETGYSRTDLEELVLLVIETRGEKGSFISYHGERFAIDPYPVKKIVDPTGCGDAYRAGFLYEFLRGASEDEQRSAASAPSKTVRARVSWVPSEYRERNGGESQPKAERARGENVVFPRIKKAGFQGSRLASYVLGITGTQGYLHRPNRIPPPPAT